MATNFTTDPAGEVYTSHSSGETVGVLMIVIRPSICGLGFITNILSLMVFLQPTMRNLSCSVYLATKAISDFIFLMTSFIVWLTSVDVGLFNTDGVCQLVLFATYLTAFISIWLVVALTIENLLCVVKPWFVQRSCNARTARILTTVIVVLGIGFYHFALWNNGLRQQTRLVEKVVDISKSKVDSPGQAESLAGTEASKELILIQKVFNFTGVTEPADLSDVVEINVINKNPLFINDQEPAGDRKTNLNNPAAANGSTLLQQTLHQQPTAGITPAFDFSAISNPTNTTYVLETGPTACLPLEEFNHLAVAMTYVDSLMTLLVPLIILSVTNAAIIILALRASRRQRRRDLHKFGEQYSYHQPAHGYTSTSCATLDINVENDNQLQRISTSSSTNIPCDGGGHKKQKVSNASRNGSIPATSGRRSTASLETQASRFLFSVSMTLLLFHMPSHLLRLKYLLLNASALDVYLFRWFETLYISHYAIGFFVYIAFGTNFRRVFLKLLGRS